MKTFRVYCNSGEYLMIFEEHNKDKIFEEYESFQEYEDSRRI
jgi:hypothetical protein